MRPVTLDMLERISAQLQTKHDVASVIKGIPPKQRLGSLTLSLMGSFSPAAETPIELAKLDSALKFLSPDVGRGNGSFYDSKGTPENDYWLATVWAISSLGWSSGEAIARSWSQASDRYTDDGFDQAWKGYKPNHANPIGIGSLYKKAKDLGWQATSAQVTPSTTVPTANIVNEPSRFNLLGLNQLSQLPPNEWVVKGVLPTRGLASIYGPSGSGKTFLVLDLLMAITTKPDWFGFKTKNVPVIYIGLEGKAGITRRVEAWVSKNKVQLPINFKVMLDNFDLLARNQINELADTIKQVNMTSGVIVIDTLNQASPGADENSSKDMGVIINHLKMLQELTTSLVLIVHHTGKNTAAGLRGHSSLKAALDTNIEVIGGDNRSWLLDKNKDGADGQSFAFKLEVVHLGIDADGESVTSCVVERNTNVLFQKPEPSGKSQKAAYALIKQTMVLSSDFNKCNSGTKTACIKVEDAVTKLASTLTTLASNKRSNRARAIIGSLIQGGYLGTGLQLDEGWIWLP